jgi:hypothetical protein
MRPWPRHPVIYEINTWVWLREISRKYRKPMNLATVPEQEWDAIASYGFDAVWLMGVWERSPAGIAISMAVPGLLESFRNTLPDFSAEDNVGSPYCVRRYVVDPYFGGATALALARTMLRLRGIRLILDFVSNHLAPDHPWAIAHPDFFIQGNADDLKNTPESFVTVGAHIFALGRDPYYPAWPDVLQLNVFHLGLRQAMGELVRDIATQCDGLRCDMAMLVMNSVFERTWGPRAGTRAATDYWAALIPAIKEKHAEFRFIAEAYWGLEWELQQQGFDHCYDKQLYDRLEKGCAEQVHLHLGADPEFQQKLVRFIENHDEPRAASTFPPAKLCAAAVAALTLPGAKLLHQGQLEGLKVRVPVFLRRRPAEPADRDIVAFYRRLMKTIDRDIFRHGDWQRCERSGWSDNQSCRNILAWCWTRKDERFLVVINLSPEPAQARVHLQWPELRGRQWRLDDVMSNRSYDREGDEMRDVGLYVDLKSWEYCFFKVNAI